MNSSAKPVHPTRLPRRNPQHQGIGLHIPVHHRPSPDKRVTVVDFVRDAIYKKIDQEKVPNRETIKAIEESRKGIGINEYSSFKDMIQKIKKELKEEGLQIND